MTDRVIRLGRRTREEIVKRNQMTALRFQTGGETSDIPGLRGTQSLHMEVFDRATKACS